MCYIKTQTSPLNVKRDEILDAFDPAYYLFVDILQFKVHHFRYYLFIICIYKCSIRVFLRARIEKQTI